MNAIIDFLMNLKEAISKKLLLIIGICAAMLGSFWFVYRSGEEDSKYKCIVAEEKAHERLNKKSYDLSIAAAQEGRKKIKDLEAERNAALNEIDS